MVRPTRAELESENLVLYRELEGIRDRLDDLLLEDDEYDGTDGGQTDHSDQEGDDYDHRDED